MTAHGVRHTTDLLRRGELSALEHTTAVLAAAREHDTLDAYVAVAGEEALRAATRADALIRERGADAWRTWPLLGVTVSVKDLLQTRDLPTVRGSLLPNDRPRQDAPAVARLRAAGAVVVGKTATSEYGWSACTLSRVAPPVRNPHDPRLTAGGSSGGAAAAVAAGLCDAALGTDGAGSIRIPAAFCGVVGYKPTLGRIPYVPNSADRLAHQGPLARTVADAALLAHVMAGPHPADPDSALGSLDAPRADRGLRIGWIDYDTTTDEVRQNLRATLRTVMDHYDVLAMATVPVEPFAYDAIAPPWAADPRDLRWLAWAPAAYPFNMTGQPALSLPAGLTRAGLPVGVQLVGPVGGDDLILSLAGRLESDLGTPAPPPARTLQPASAR
jgi:aspartyl-tRNA(Asn)/glutamyl-tRNA(Gln) amidotransferase subunit A